MSDVDPIEAVCQLVEKLAAIDDPLITAAYAISGSDLRALRAALPALVAMREEAKRLRAMDDVPAFNAGWELRNGPCPREGDDGWSEAMEMGWLWAHAEKLRGAEAHVEHLKGVAKHQTERGNKWLAECEALRARVRELEAALEDVLLTWRYDEHQQPLASWHNLEDWKARNVVVASLARAASRGAQP